MTAIFILLFTNYVCTYFVINGYLKDKAFEEDLAKCKNQDEIGYIFDRIKQFT